MLTVPVRYVWHYMSSSHDLLFAQDQEHNFPWDMVKDHEADLEEEAFIFRYNREGKSPKLVRIFSEHVSHLVTFITLFILSLYSFYTWKNALPEQLKRVTGHNHHQWVYKALWSLIVNAVMLKAKSKTKAAPAAAATNHVSHPIMITNIVNLSCYIIGNQLCTRWWWPLIKYNI